MNFDLNKVREAKQVLDKIDTYNAIKEYEQQNMNNIYGSEDELSSSFGDPDDYLKIDQNDLDACRATVHCYQEALKNQTFQIPLIVDPPKERLKTQLEYIIEEVQREYSGPEAQRLIDEKVREAAKKTIVLPIECLPPDFVVKQRPKSLAQPKRLLNSQLDQCFQASKQTESSRDTLKKQMDQPTTRQVDTTKVKQWNPSRSVMENSQRLQRQILEKTMQQYDEIDRRKVESRNKIRAETQRLIMSERAKRPRLTEKDYQLTELLKLQKSVNKVNRECNLIKGYENLLKSAQSAQRTRK